MTPPSTAAPSPSPRSNGASRKSPARRSTTMVISMEDALTIEEVQGADAGRTGRTRSSSPDSVADVEEELRLHPDEYDDQ